MSYRIGTSFVVGDEVVYEEKGTEVLCTVKARRAHDGMVFYDLSPFRIVLNKKRLGLGEVFTVGIRLDSNNKTSWGLRIA